MSGTRWCRQHPFGSFLSPLPSFPLVEVIPRWGRGQGGGVGNQTFANDLGAFINTDTQACEINLHNRPHTHTTWGAHREAPAGVEHEDAKIQTCWNSNRIFSLESPHASVSRALDLAQRPMSQMRPLRLDVLPGVGFQDGLACGHSTGGRGAGVCKEQGALCMTHRKCSPDLDVHKVVLNIHN